MAFVIGVKFRIDAAVIGDLVCWAGLDPSELSDHFDRTLDACRTGDVEVAVQYQTHHDTPGRVPMFPSYFSYFVVFISILGIQFFGNLCRIEPGVVDPFPNSFFDAVGDIEVLVSFLVCDYHSALAS